MHKLNRVLAVIVAVIAALAMLLPTTAFAATLPMTVDSPLKAADSTLTATSAQAKSTASSATTSASTSQKNNVVTEDQLSAQAKALTQAATSKSGVVSSYTPTQSKELANQRYSSVPVIGNLLNTVLSTDKNVGKLDLSGSSDSASTLDGTTIEKLTVKWLDTDQQTNEQTPTSNTAMSFGARVSFSVSGQNSYNPGDLQITIPLNIFKDRFGKDEGNIDMSVPEDPSQDAVMTYKRVDNKIIVSNTQTLPAGYQGYFDVYFDNVVPSELVSGQTSADFGAILNVTTSKGNTLRKTSNTINAKVNTSETVKSVTKRSAGIYTSEPEGLKKLTTRFPSGKSAADYYYVDWYIYAYVSGNQYFNLSITDTPSKDETVPGSTEKYVNGIVVGTDVPNATFNSDGTMTATGVISDGTPYTKDSAKYTYVNDGNNFYYHVYVAYPKSEFQPQEGQISDKNQLLTKQLKNTVSYTLTQADSATTSSPVSASATDTYRAYPWYVPVGHFRVHKWGVDSTGAGASLWRTDYHYDNGKRVYNDYDPVKEAKVQMTDPYDSKHVGLYPYALNTLAQGDDVNLTYSVNAENYPYPWTCSSHNPAVKSGKKWLPGACPTNDASVFGKSALDFTNTDDGVYFNEQSSAGGTALTGADYKFTQLRVLVPYMQSYQQVNNVHGTYWGYAYDSSIAEPDETFYGKTDTGNWVEYAKVTWNGKGLSSTPTITAANDATVNGDIITFPTSQNITHWKVTYSTAAAGITVGVIPTLALHGSSSTIQSAVKKLMSNSDTSEYTDVRNTATEDVTQQEKDADGKPVTAQVYHQDAKGSEDINGKSTVTDANGDPDSAGVDRLSSAAQSVWMTKDGEQLAQTDADKAARQVQIKYTANVYSVSNQISADDYNTVVNNGTLGKDVSGTYYDLLPLGFRVDPSSITADGMASYTTVDNWRGSGRTMLIVRVNNNTTPVKFGSSVGSGVYTGKYGTKHSITFKGIYTWNEIKDISLTLTNNIAYASNSKVWGTVPGLIAEPDAVGKDYKPYNSTDQSARKYKNQYTPDAVSGVEDLMTNLDDNADAAKPTVYAAASTVTHARTYALAGLQKDVSSDTDGKWGTGLDANSITVPTGGAYKYRLRMENGNDSETKNIVFYDDIEAYQPTADKADHGDAQWYGSFLGVDTAALQAKGIAPVVYYALKHVDLTQYKVDGSTNSIPNLHDTSVWTTTLPADPSTVKAIAIDCSKKADGSDYVLAANDGLQVTLRMKAPEGDTAKTAIDQKAHAYNNVYMSSTEQASTGDPVNHYIHQDYTKVGLEPYNVVVKKQWDDDNNRDGLRTGSVTVQLMQNGKAYGDPVELSASNDWTHTFSYLPRTDAQGAPYTYTVAETNTPNGYTYTPSITMNGGTMNVAAINKHTPATVDVAGSKTWSGDNPQQRPSVVKLWLKQNGKRIQSQLVTSDTSGNWKYSFTGLPKHYRDGNETKDYTYTVEEDYTEGYVPSTSDPAVVTDANGNDTSTINVTNEYYPYGDISLTKSITDTTATKESKNKKFTFMLTLRKKVGTDSNGAAIWQYDAGTYSWTRTNKNDLDTDLADTGTIANGGKVSLYEGETITVHKVASSYDYEWTEDGSDGFTVGTSTNMTGTVRSSKTQTAAASVDNVYKTVGSVQLEAKKTLTGHAMRMNQFQFEVQDTAGNVVRAAYNDADGSVKFSKIGYTNVDVGKPHTYKIVERDLHVGGYTYDKTVFYVNVDVKDMGDGTITATPTYYHANADGTQGAALTDADETATKASAAKVDGSTTLVPQFNNEYHAKGEMSLKATKVFVGGDLSQRQFTFELCKDAPYGDANAKNCMEATTAKTASKSVTATEAVFKPVKFTEQDVSATSTPTTYTYYISEKKDDGDTKVVWDGHVQKVTATITDNGDGTLNVKQDFSVASGTSPFDTPMVWKNVAGNGSLKIEKTIIDDPATVKQRNQIFPVEIALMPPQGGTLPTTITAKVYTPKWTSATATDLHSNGYTESTQTAKVDSKGGIVKFAVPAMGYLQIDGLPGGTTYMVSEVSE